MAKRKPPTPYADTKVSVIRSRSEIDKVLDKHGVRAVQWTTIEDASVLRFQFEYQGRSFFVRFVVDPKRQGDPWKPGRITREKHSEREARRLHRILYYAVKSKLEVIESGLESPFQVWLPQIETGSGGTVAEMLDLHVDQLSVPRASLGDLLALPEAKS